METTGAQLAQAFYTSAVLPLLTAEFPGLRHAAGRLGSGSDILGFDDAMSRDHDWGCRLTLLVDQEDAAQVSTVDGLLADKLPETFGEYPVRFSTTWDPQVRHRVEVATVHDFGSSRLGVPCTEGIDALDWLLLTGQSVLEVTAGPVFADDTGKLGPLRQLLSWYPADVERVVLATAWSRLAQRLPLVGRTAELGQTMQSRLLSADLAQELIRLAFLVQRRWAPYAKWLERAFHALPSANALDALLERASFASDWHHRESALAVAAQMLLDAQKSLGLPGPKSATAAFFDRPFRTVDPEVMAQLRAQVQDPRLRALPDGVGAIDQWIDRDELLSRPERRAAARDLYLRWAQDKGEIPGS